MRKILIVFIILFFMVWIYSSRKEKFTTNSNNLKNFEIKYVADDQDQPTTQTVTISAYTEMINLTDIYDKIGILAFEYDWTQTDDDLNPGFENDQNFKPFENIVIDSRKTIFLKRQHNRTIIGKELLILVNNILKTKELQNNDLYKVVNINDIKNDIDLETSINLLEPSNEINFIKQQDKDIKETTKRLLETYKIVFKIATLNTNTKEDLIYKITNEIESADRKKIIEKLQKYIENSSDNLDKINFNINFPEFKINIDNKFTDEDIEYLNQVLNIILSKYRLVDLRKKVKNKSSIFYVSPRNRNLLMSYILNTNNLEILPFDPNKSSQNNITTTASPTTTLPPTTTTPITTTTPFYTVQPTTTEAPTTTTSVGPVVNKDSLDFIRNIINSLKILSENYYAFFENIPIDIILYPQLFVSDDVPFETSIFKEMINKTLQEYNQRYVYISPDIIEEQLPEFIDRKNVFQVPEHRKQIEYKRIIRLNEKAREDQLKKRHYRKFDVKKIPINFSKATIDIMNDLVNLYSAKENFTLEDNKSEIKNLWQKWKYYSTNTFMILTDNGRMFYVGVFLFVISILVYFSDLF